MIRHSEKKNKKSQYGKLRLEVIVLYFIYIFLDDLRNNKKI